MPAFDLDTFAEDGILREATVRAAFASLNWEQYRGKTVHIRGCGKAMIPTWAYLMAAAHLAQVAKKITFGEDRSPMLIFIPEEFAKQIESKVSVDSSKKQ